MVVTGELIGGTHAGDQALPELGNRVYDRPSRVVVARDEVGLLEELQCPAEGTVVDRRASVDDQRHLEVDVAQRSLGQGVKRWPCEPEPVESSDQVSVYVCGLGFEHLPPPVGLCSW